MTGPGVESGTFSSVGNDFTPKPSARTCTKRAGFGLEKMHAWI